MAIFTSSRRVRKPLKVRPKAALNCVTSSKGRAWCWQRGGRAGGAAALQECKAGGLRIQGKLVLVKNGDEGANTILMPSNHSINIEDRGDGKYLMHVTVNFSSTVKLIVNMDKDLPGTSGELPPIQLVFVDERSRDRRQPRERPGAGVVAGAPRSATPELEPSLEPAHHKSRPSTPDPG